MRVRIADLLAACAAAGASCAIAFGLEAPWRIFALVPMFFTPGYALAAGLFPYGALVQGSGGLSHLERLGVAFLLSVAFIPVAAYLLDASSVPISLGSVSGACLVTTLLGAIYAWHRRRIAPTRVRDAGEGPLAAVAWVAAWARPRRRWALAAACVATFTLCAVVLAGLGPPTDFVEATLVGPSGKLNDLPTNATVGTTFAFEVVLRSHHEGVKTATTTLIHERGDHVAAGARSAFAPGSRDTSGPTEVQLPSLENVTIPFTVTFDTVGLHRVQVEVATGEGRPLLLQHWVDVR